MKNTIIVALFVLVWVSAHARTDVLTMAGYGYMDVNGQVERSFSGVLAVQRGEDKTADVNGIDYLFASAAYGNYRYASGLDYGHPDEFHSIGAVLNYKKRAHEFLAVVTSDSADPFKNKRTFQAGAVYGYTLLHSDNFLLVVGGGAAGGGQFDIIPVPYIMARYDTALISAKFDFITNPSLEIVVLPENTISILLDTRADGFEQAEDVYFTAALRYRPFSGDMEFINFSAGVKSDGNQFDTTAKDTAFYMHAYSAFAEADLGLIKLNGGYIFDSKEIYTNNNEITKKGTGTGYYVSATALFAF